jgi:hypothetical protein
MTHYIRFISFFFIAILFISCNDNGSNFQVIEIDVESEIDNMQVINLSQFADDIEYFSLETSSNSLIADYNTYDIGEDNIIFTNPEMSLVLFDRSGSFVMKFGNKGQGPGEYLSVKNLSIVGQNVFFSSGKDLYEFSLNGEFLHKYTDILAPQDRYQLEHVTFVDDSLLFGHIENNDGQTPFKGMLINKKGFVNKKYDNFDIIDNKGSRINGGSTQVYTFSNSVHFKEQFNDTSFYIDNDFSLIPKFSFIMGDLKMPESIRANFFEYFQKMNNYHAIENILETSDYLFLDINFGNHFPANSLTPLKGSGPGGADLKNHTTNCLAIYNKETFELQFCKPTSIDNPLFTSGLYNDIDAGPRFFPSSQVNDSTFVMLVNPFDLKKHVESDEFTKSRPLYPEKKNELKMLADSLRENDNPVLMLVSIK